MSGLRIEQAIPARETGKLRNLFDTSLCPMEYRLGTDQEQLSVTRFSSISLSGLDVMRDEGVGYREGIRNPEHIQSHPSDEFLICLPHHSQIQLQQTGADSCFGEGSFSFLSTLRPFSALITAESSRGCFAQTIVLVAGPLLRSRVPHIDDCCSRPIGIRPGAGRIMQSLLDLALAEGGALSPAQVNRFSTALIDAIADATLAAPELATLQNRLPYPAKLRLLEQAKRFIAMHLADPELDATAVARHCCVSVRYLRAAFATSPHTVGSFIREARLHRCQAALQSPALAGHSIMDIAMSWGFNDAAYFSRAYRMQFGVPPSEDRHTTT